MKSFNIALKNIRKSHNDYTVYFFTLIIGVAIFYMFNAIGTQGAMTRVAASGNSLISVLVTVIRFVSVLVAMVLGLLIIYANNFLIKRRKKEFGIYMLLGMSKQVVSTILVWETCIIGFISLLAGLLLGTFGGQFLSILVTRMFEMDVSSYRFEISFKAILMTVISFACIFLVVLVFNVLVVSKKNLIDLIGARKKNEKAALKNPVLSVLLFIISAVLLGIALVRVGIYGMEVHRTEFIIHILIGLVGTFTLFGSMAGFLQKLAEHLGAFYKKGLCSFVIRQFTGNINTSAVSFALITLILFLALCFFSTGFSIRTYLNKRLANATPVDVTIETEGDKPVTDLLAERGIDSAEFFDECLDLPIYQSPRITISTTLGSVLDKAKEQFPLARWNTPENVMTLSDYNQIERMFGRKELSLKENEYAVISSFEMLNTFTNSALEQNNPLEMNSVTLTPGYEYALDEFLLMSETNISLGVVIVPDSVAADPENNFSVSGRFLAGNYSATSSDERYHSDSVLKESLGDSLNMFFDEEGAPHIPVTLATANSVRDSSVGTSVIVVFLVLYIGIVFVIACAAIIALKVLTDSLDSAPRFEILRRIGADEAMRGRALLIQVLLNFLLPLSIAGIYTAFALRFIRDALSAFGALNMISGISTTLVIMLLLYGGYFLTTCFGCNKIIMNSSVH